MINFLKKKWYYIIIIVLILQLLGLLVGTLKVIITIACIAFTLVGGFIVIGALE